MNNEIYDPSVLESIETRLSELTDQYAKSSPELKAAINYSLLSGGKRLRALLVKAASQLIDPDNKNWIDCACALEMMHCYSLIHDDLPAMDDDNLRRGKPTNHIQFDEATAILAGDALLTMAFEVIANTSVNDSIKIKQIQILAHASGANGMVAGQAIDLASTNQEIDFEHLKTMHKLKTGALILASVQIGALCEPNITPSQQSALKQYAQNIGLGFQIIDDVLDVESDTQTLGKPQGSDSEANKSTYVKHLGLQTAKDTALQLIEQACEHIQIFEHPQMLNNIALFVLNRKH
ncbi:polyprenyl synthetase family protein [Marinicellulosiphila megalodicopiae]|uniref:polyprenyl synthetase family protein n=1 Tax=Marinicellulosiphila megalodicopiae TaxID=2724896 RepID=UPI003BB1D1F9